MSVRVPLVYSAATRAAKTYQLPVGAYRMAPAAAMKLSALKLPRPCAMKNWSPWCQ
jgi:hypothetical protein